MKQKDNPFVFTTGTVGYPLLFVMVMWLVFWLEFRLRLNLVPYGIYPQKLSGLKGILFSPWIHGDLQHLFNNSIPLFVLTAFLFYFYRQQSWRVLILGLVFTGFLTWLIGRPSYHIGASGMVYMLVTFLFFKGIFSQYYRLVAISMMVVFLYGGLVWYIFPTEQGISWEGHLAGSITGLILAIFTKNIIYKPKLYAWEQEDYNPEEDEFMQMFDEDGNFVGKPKEELTHSEENSFTSSVSVTYSYREKSASNPPPHKEP